MDKYIRTLLDSLLVNKIGTAIEEWLQMHFRVAVLSRDYTYMSNTIKTDFFPNNFLLMSCFICLGKHTQNIRMMQLFQPLSPTVFTQTEATGLQQDFCV